MQVIKSCAALAAALLVGGCLATTSDEVSRFDTGEIVAPVLETPAGYNRLFSPAAHNFRAGKAEVGDPVRFGTLSERFELRDGDCGGSDCVEPRARSEIQMTKAINTARIGQNIWYGYSFYNASVPAFREQSSLRLVFGQWTVGGENRPAFRFIQLGKGEGNFGACDPSVCTKSTPKSGDLVVHLSDIAEAKGWGARQNDGYICRLFDMADRRGQWVDVTVNTNFSAGPNGYLKIWIDGRQVCDYSGPMVSRESFRAAAHPQHRRGIYSSWDKRWRKATNDARKPNLIVYYDEFRAGPTRAEADVRMNISTQQAAVD